MRILPVVPVAVLLVATAAAANYSTAGLRRVEPDQPAPARSPAPPPDLAQPAAPSPAAAPDRDFSVLGDAVLAGVLAGALALLLASGWVLIRRLRRAGGWSRALRRGHRLRAPHPAGAGGPAGGVPGEQMLAAVDEAVARSEDDHDPRRAVIACWVRLAEAAGEAGVPRHDSDTATDLVVRLLRGHQVSEPVLSAFVEAYWLARYASHAVDEQMRTQARSALRHLRAELRGEAAATAPGRGPRPGPWPGP